MRKKRINFLIKKLYFNDRTFRIKIYFSEKQISACNIQRQKKLNRQNRQKKLNRKLNLIINASSSPRLTSDFPGINRSS